MMHTRYDRDRPLSRNQRGGLAACHRRHRGGRIPSSRKPGMGGAFRANYDEAR